jgi:tetratricopeptide (TPR) repeat protein
LYLNETTQALQDALASADLGARVGNLRAEIVSRLTAGWLYSSLGKVTEAQQQYESALKTAHNISAHRFVPFLLEGVAKCHHIAGHTNQATENIRQAWSLVEEQKLHRFIGPWVLGTRAIIERDESLRTQAIDMGLKIIEDGCVAHNYYRFYVSAGEAAVQSRSTARASHMADMLETFTSEQPCTWADHHIALLRLHVRLLLKGTPQDHEKLHMLIHKGQQDGLSFVTPYLHGHLT